LLEESGMMFTLQQTCYTDTKPETTVSVGILHIHRHECARTHTRAYPSHTPYKEKVSTGNPRGAGGQNRFLFLIMTTIEARSITPEPEFLNIYWRLKSRLSAKSCLFKGQRVLQGSCRLLFLFADRKSFSV
jgi:hypothetical protein